MVAGSFRKVNVTEQKSNYDMIVSQDILSELGINLNFKDMTVQWDTAVIPMKQIDSTIKDLYAVEDSEALHDSTEQIKKILDAKYKPGADLDEVVSAARDSSGRRSATKEARPLSRTEPWGVGLWRLHL